MSNRRDITAALLIGAPIVSRAVTTNSTNQVAQKKAPLEPLSEETARIISYTIYAEARGESFKGKKAVAAVIATRAKIIKKSMAYVCIQPKQFSCWNEISEVPSNYSMGLKLHPADIKARSECYGLAWLLLSGHVKWDHLTHFYNPSKASPEWKRNMDGVQMIGDHVFGYMDSKHLPR